MSLEIDAAGILRWVRQEGSPAPFSIEQLAKNEVVMLVLKRRMSHVVSAFKAQADGTLHKFACRNYLECDGSEGCSQHLSWDLSVVTQGRRLFLIGPFCLFLQ